MSNDGGNRMIHVLAFLAGVMVGVVTAVVVWG